VTCGRHFPYRACLRGRPGVFEVRELYLDAIAAARQHLFFENQYFTSNVLSEAIGARLREPEGPEVAVISPQTQSGWLEQATMGALRARIHHRLKSALDDQGQEADARYQMYCPHLPGLEDGSCLNVHSKVFTMDDRLISVGSANMSNRSMAFDTECNLTIEVQGDAEAGRNPQRHRPHAQSPAGRTPRRGAGRCTGGAAARDCTRPSPACANLSGANCGPWTRA
jgi:phosphatidylserine/phosphatidylglycerophosphate/cardiolipin synthase-like enzyme